MVCPCATRGNADTAAGVLSARQQQAEVATVKGCGCFIQQQRTGALSSLGTAAYGAAHSVSHSLALTATQGHWHQWAR